MTVTVIDGFAGPGGWSVACQKLGLEETGIEFDASACDTRRAAGHKTVQADITTLDPTWYPADGAIFSPPCQSFSTAGKGEGRAKLPHVLEALKVGYFAEAQKDGKTELVCEPMRWISLMARRAYPYKWIAMEQVPTVLPIWEAYAEQLRKFGYFTWTGILNAEQYGVPQTRRRAFLLANLDWEMSAPVPTHSRYYNRTPSKLDPDVKPWASMAEALGWTESFEAVSNYGTGGDSSNRGVRRGEDPSATITSKADRVVYRSDNRPNSAVRGLDCPAPTVLQNGERGTHAAWEFSPAGKTCATVKHRPMHEPAHTVTAAGNAVWTHDRPSTTVNCDPRISKPGRHDPAVSGSQQKDAIRVTVQEGGILQSFPADYPWQGTKTKQFEQVGNAVPPLLAEAVLRMCAR